jgi:hypothetical protein
MAGYRISGGAPAGMKAILQPDGSIFQTGFRGLAKDRTPLRTDRSALMRCLPRFSKITSFAKCASTHCACRRSAARLRSGGSGLRAARFVGLVRCRQSPDTSTPVAPRPNYRPRTRAQNCRCYRAGRAQRFYLPADRAGAALSCDEGIVFLRRKSIFALAPTCCIAGAPSLSIGHVLGISLSSALVPKHCLPSGNSTGGGRQQRGAQRRRARPVAEAPRAMQADVVICRGAKGAKRSSFARRRSSRRCRKMRRAAPVWRTARENQKARAAGAGGRSTSNRISPSRRSSDSCQAML